MTWRAYAGSDDEGCSVKAETGSKNVGKSDVDFAPRRMTLVEVAAESAAATSGEHEMEVLLVRLGRSGDEAEEETDGE